MAQAERSLLCWLALVERTAVEFDRASSLAPVRERNRSRLSCRESRESRLQPPGELPGPARPGAHTTRALVSTRVCFRLNGCRPTSTANSSTATVMEDKSGDAAPDS
jgi:hypothetical protein